MDVGTLSLLIVVGILTLLVVSVPLVFAAGVAGVLLGYFMRGVPGIIPLLQRVYAISTADQLLSVPLFLLMAALLERGGVAREMFDAIDACFAACAAACCSSRR